MRVQVPSNANPQEPKEPRVCFAPTVAQCVQGIVSGRKATEDLVLIELMPGSFCKRWANPVVYKTRKALFKPSSTIADFDLTEEHWSLKPIEVRRHGYVDLRALLLQAPNLPLPVTNTAVSVFTESEYLIWKHSRKRAKAYIL